MSTRKQSKGLFISFEGGEGAGKSTQAKWLARYLENQGYKVKVSREPGGSKISEAIRTVTHNPAYTKLSVRAEALLFAAARAQLVAEVYQPFLTKNYIVIADRYVDSSYVYQGFARGLGIEEIKTINEFAIGGLLPDLTFLLEIDHKTGHQRRQSTSKVDRMDLQKQGFYEAVDKGYQQLVKLFPKRIIPINANQPMEVVHQTIVEQIKKILKP